MKTAEIFTATTDLSFRAATRHEQIAQVHIIYGDDNYPRFAKLPAVDTCCIPDKRLVIEMNAKRIFNLVFTFKN